MAEAGRDSAESAAWPRVLELAARGRFSTSPNPRVGAVLLSPRGEVVGEGFHERAGGPHAEVAALAAAGERARGATLLVNLEPCAHTGRTGPCAEAVAAAGVARVVASIADPDRRTAGRGFARLREAGIEVETGPFARESSRLNEAFLVSVSLGRPFVHLKWASSLDGRIAAADGRAKWITGEEARREAMLLREECDAILVGAGTVLADEPRLTRRLGLNSSIPPHRRIVLDGRLRVSAAAAVFDPAGPGPSGSEAWLATARAEGDPALVPFRERGVRVLALPGLLPGPGGLRALLSALDRAGCRSLLVEGGGETAWGFVAAGLVDRVTAFVAPTLLGGAAAPAALSGEGFLDLSALPRLSEVEVSRAGEDLVVTGRLGVRLA